jgi:hypothetical protein
LGVADNDALTPIAAAVTDRFKRVLATVTDYFEAASVA